MFVRIKGTRNYLRIARVEAGSNTFTMTLRVVRGDEMGLKIGRAIA
jgi:hypothetical protein